MKPTVSLLTTLMLAPLAALQAADSPKDGAKPNVIVILTDDQGWGDLTSYQPDSKIVTPNMARLRETALAWQATLPDGPRTENPGSLDYPGYHEAPGRGPLLDRAKYEKLLEPVRIRLMRQQAPSTSPAK